MKTIIKYRILAVCTIVNFGCMAQIRVYSDSIYCSSIKTPKAYILGNERSYPAIELNGENTLLIQLMAQCME